MASRPAYSPCEPALGCSGDGREARDLGQPGLELREQLGVALRLVRGRERVQLARTRGQVTGSISEVALSFIVHEPSGIIEVVSERSRASSRWM